MWANCKSPYREDGAFPVFTPTGYYMQDAEIDDPHIKRTRKELLDSLRCVVPSPKLGRHNKPNSQSPASLPEAFDDEVRAFHRWDGRGYNEEATWGHTPTLYKQEAFVTEWPDFKASLDEGQHFGMSKDEARDDSLHTATPKLTSPPRKEKTVSLSSAKSSTSKKMEGKIVDFNPIAYMDSLLQTEGVKKTTSEKREKKSVPTLLSRIQKLEAALREEGIPIVRLDSNGMPSGPSDMTSIGQEEKASPRSPSPVDETMNQLDPLSLLDESDIDNDGLDFPPIRWLCIDHGSVEEDPGGKVCNVNQRFDAWEVSQQRELFLSKSSPFRLKRRGTRGHGTTRVGNSGVSPSVGSDQTWSTPESEFWSWNHANGEVW